LETLSGALSATYRIEKKAVINGGGTTLLNGEDESKTLIHEVIINVNGVDVDNTIEIRRDNAGGELLWKWSGNRFDRENVIIGDFPIVGITGRPIYITVSEGTYDATVSVKYLYVPSRLLG